MIRSYICSAAVLAALLISPTSALADDGQAAHDAQAKPINAMCPIGKEPIQASAKTIEYKGNVIGFCCPSCSKAFMAWDENRRDAFVDLALAGDEPGHMRHRERAALMKSAEKGAEDKAAVSFPYPLDVCPVSGQKLGSMGDPVVKTYDGREVRFCCANCIEKFESDKDTYWQKVDEQIVATQLMHYPIDACIVSGSKLGSMGKPINYVYNNRLVRFCCGGCKPKLEADPKAYFRKLDQKIIEQQIKTYPLDTCVVSDAKLGSMGDPVNYIYENRLVRFCCADCIETFESNPAAHMDKIDKAYADAQRESYPLDVCVVSGEKLGSMGEPVEVVAGTQLVRFCCDGCLPKFRANPESYLEKIRE
jgi:YHS domain-containing protein